MCSSIGSEQRRTELALFIKERASVLGHNAAARLQAIEDLYQMIQSAKQDYQNKISKFNATFSTPTQRD
jgi:hypothetical protein